MKGADNLRCLFTAHVQQQGDSYVIDVPQRELAVGDIELDDVYRVAMIAAETHTASPTDTDSPTDRSQPAERDSPPVEKNERLTVEIEDVGDQGDGIARVGEGYVIIVPSTELGDRVTIEITDVRENMAFAEVVDQADQ